MNYIQRYEDLECKTIEEKSAMTKNNSFHEK